MDCVLKRLGHRSRELPLHREFPNVAVNLSVFAFIIVCVRFESDNVTPRGAARKKTFGEDPGLRPTGCAPGYATTENDIVDVLYRSYF